MLETFVNENGSIYTIVFSDIPANINVSFRYIDEDSTKVRVRISGTRAYITEIVSSLVENWGNLKGEDSWDHYSIVIKDCYLKNCLLDIYKSIITNIYML